MFPPFSLCNQLRCVNEQSRLLDYHRPATLLPEDLPDLRVAGYLRDGGADWTLNDNVVRSVSAGSVAVSVSALRRLGPELSLHVSVSVTLPSLRAVLELWVASLQVFVRSSSYCPSVCPSIHFVCLSVRAAQWLETPKWLATRLLLTVILLWRINDLSFSHQSFNVVFIHALSNFGW